MPKQTEVTREEFIVECLHPEARHEPGQKMWRPVGFTWSTEAQAVDYVDQARASGSVFHYRIRTRTVTVVTTEWRWTTVKIDAHAPTPA